MFGLGTTELIIILVLALIIFGAGRLPEVGSALGKGIKNFKKGVSSVNDEVEEEEPKKKEIKDEA
ncbi:MAG: twin-arginine translocase TatA/TatE family subunit [Deltaproteobacteria bacterium]|nr:twin-arginine translocase TatA/TatE family subunit [Candidatus Zymogenaceae bacterium]